MKSLKKVLVLASIVLASFSGHAAQKLYRSGSQAENWVKANPTDKRAKLIKEKIVSQPQCIWLAGHISTSLMDDAEHAEQNHEVLTVVTYNLPDRDNGNYSKGGLSGPAAYAKWVDQVRDNLVSTSAQSIVIVEPDAIGLAPQMKDPKTGLPDRVKIAQRYQMLSNSVVTLKKSQNTKVYLAISGWLGVDGAVAGLKKSGIDLADGFAYNISGYHDLKECHDFCEQLSERLGGMHYIIDTSRCGNGQWKPTDPEEKKEAWCNAPGRALGNLPTFDTGHPHCDAYLWVKRPGESDGKKRSKYDAGQFDPDNAFELASNAKT